MNDTDIPVSQRLSRTTSSLPPCCLVVHPKDKSLVIVGTYKLHEGDLREGTIEIYKVDLKDKSLKLAADYAAGSAILDLKIHPKNLDLIFTCHSTGEVKIWRIDIGDLTLKEQDHHQIVEKTTLLTSMAFSPNSDEEIALTATDGSVSTLCYGSGRHSITQMHTTHDLECWIGAYGQVGDLRNVLFTGGDDGRLIAHDLRSSMHIWSTNYNHHDAGVTSILCPSETWNANKNNHLWTGSYDDCLRIFDLRVMDSRAPSLIEGYLPRVIQKKNLGGGVWRLLPSLLPNDDRVLSCCMYDGARIVEVNDSGFEVSRYFKGDHESMCYAGDWSTDGEFVVTSSFYDKVIQVWSPDEVLSQ